MEWEGTGWGGMRRHDKIKSPKGMEKGKLRMKHLKKESSTYDSDC